MDFRLSEKEEKLVEAIRDCVEFSPTRLPTIISIALSDMNVKAFMFFLGLSEVPVVASTLEKKDISSSVTLQLLMKAFMGLSALRSSSDTTCSSDKNEQAS